MKTAEQRADEVADLMGVGKYDDDTRNRIALSFKEHARDQRHLCAEAVAARGVSVNGFTPAGELTVDPEVALHGALAATVNAPAPGQKTTPVQENG